MEAEILFDVGLVILTRQWLFSFAKDRWEVSIWVQGVVFRGLTAITRAMVCMSELE
jgi:hypothetical protein